MENYTQAGFVKAVKITNRRRFAQTQIAKLLKTFPKIICSRVGYGKNGTFVIQATPELIEEFRAYYCSVHKKPGRPNSK